MFSFFHTIFVKTISLVASIVIAVGLVSAPNVPNNHSTTTQVIETKSQGNQADKGNPKNPDLKAEIIDLKKVVNDKNKPTENTVKEESPSVNNNPQPQIQTKPAPFISLDEGRLKLESIGVGLYKDQQGNNYKQSGFGYVLINPPVQQQPQPQVQTQPNKVVPPRPNDCQDCTFNWDNWSWERHPYVPPAPTVNNLPPQNQPQQQQQAQTDIAQVRQNKIAALTNEYNSQVAAINQQIIDIKKQYYVDLAANNSAPIALEFQQGRAQKLLTDANAKIDQLNLQIQQLYLDYINKINQLQ